MPQTHREIHLDTHKTTDAITLEFASARGGQSRALAELGPTSRCVLKSTLHSRCHQLPPALPARLRQSPLKSLQPHQESPAGSLRRETFYFHEFTDVLARSLFWRERRPFRHDGGDMARGSFAADGIFSLSVASLSEEGSGALNFYKCTPKGSVSQDVIFPENFLIKPQNKEGQP